MVLATLLALLALWQSRRDLLFVLFAPLLMLVVANLAGKWPLGAFRTNLFTLSYSVPLLGVGLQYLAGAVSASSGRAPARFRSSSA